MSEIPQGPTSKEQFSSFVDQWLTYAAEHLTDVYIERANLGEVKQRMIAAGYADEASVARGEPLIRAMTQREVVRDQSRLLEINVERLKTLAQLAGKRPRELAGTTVVSIGGGPGDKLCEPWFPRVAATMGAKVINFDASPAHPLDEQLGLYTHIGEQEGNVFNLLVNDKTIYKQLQPDQNISIIECNNLIGNNVSPALMIDLQALGNPQNHPKIIEMRQNLLTAAGTLLADKGVLAVDNAYWVKQEDALVPVDERGERRTTPIFIEEQPQK